VSDVSSRFRDFLLADENIARLVGGRVHEDHVPQRLGAKDYPFIWYRKRQAQGAETLDSSPGEDAKFHYFDVEVVAKGIHLAKQLETLVRARCSCYRGTYGDSTVQGIFVEDQDSDYIPRSAGSDEGLYVPALDVRVIT
jgi:hypothetical protein